MERRSLVILFTCTVFTVPAGNALKQKLNRIGNGAIFTDEGVDKPKTNSDSEEDEEEEGENDEEQEQTESALGLFGLLSSLDAVVPEDATAESKDEPDLLNLVKELKEENKELKEQLSLITKTLVTIQQDVSFLRQKL